MKICIISPGYPDLDRFFFVFVERLVNEFADQGHQCVVIAPQSIVQILFRNNTQSNAEWEGGLSAFSIHTISRFLKQLGYKYEFQKFNR